VRSRKTPAPPSSAPVDPNLIPFLDVLAELVALRIVAEATFDGAPPGVSPDEHPGSPGSISTVPVECQTQSHENPKPAARRTIRDGSY
jgi:hypothetical protein